MITAVVFYFLGARLSLMYFTAVDVALQSMRMIDPVLAQMIPESTPESTKGTRLAAHVASMLWPLFVVVMTVKRIFK